MLIGFFFENFIEYFNENSLRNSILNFSGSFQIKLFQQFQSSAIFSRTPSSIPSNQALEIFLVFFSRIYSKIPSFFFENFFWNSFSNLLGTFSQSVIYYEIVQAILLKNATEISPAYFFDSFFVKYSKNFFVEIFAKYGIFFFSTTPKGICSATLIGITLEISSYTLPKVLLEIP